MAAPIVNTAIIGAFSKMSELVKIQSVVDAIMETVPIKKDANVKAAQEAYEKVIL
jgi:Pyruvate/2-oxoacid:ferredoxin oxidoreductase gamma subunit